MRRIWWIPKGDNPQDYADRAEADAAEIMEGSCDAIEPYLDGDYKTPRLIHIPTIIKRLWVMPQGAKVGKCVFITYDDELDTETDVQFQIEKQDLDTKEWKVKEILPAHRRNEWTQDKSLYYDDFGYYRIRVMSGGKPIVDVDVANFFYYE